MERLEFAEYFRQMCKKYNVKNKALAESLDLSCAAVSQFMSGVSLPSPEQLNRMLLRMGAAPADAATMRFRLMITRTGKDPIPEEAGVWPVMPDYFPVGLPNTPDILFGEDGTLPSIPLIYLEDLRTYRQGSSLNEFAKQHIRRLVYRDFGNLGAAAILETSGTEIHIADCGIVNIVLMNHLPKNHATLELCSFVNGEFYIKASDVQSHWQSFTSKDIPGGKMRWKMPILEINLTPLSRKR